MRKDANEGQNRCLCTIGWYVPVADVQRPGLDFDWALDAERAV
jgi:hypothetical protein